MSSTLDLKLKPLFKKSGNKVRIWQIKVVPLPDGTAKIVREYGDVGGKMVEQEDHIKEGKNVGKRNETSPYQQAEAEARAEWTKQKERKCYGEDPDGEESAAKRSVAPMLAQDMNRDFLKKGKQVDWETAFGQPKLDGHRCLMRFDGANLTMKTRQGKDIGTMAHIAEEGRYVLSGGGELDGELYSDELSFQEIGSAITRKQAGSEKIEFHCYDSPMNAPFADRLAFLQKNLGKHVGAIKLVHTEKIDDADHMQQFEKACIDDGYEGAMLRHTLEPYLPSKRASCLLKVKTFLDSDHEILEVNQGRGTHAGMAVFVCRAPEGAKKPTFDCLAHGTHAHKRQCWADRASMIGRLLTVKYQELTEDGVPRFPVAMRFRTDE